MSQELGMVPGEHFLNDTWCACCVLCGNAETVSHKGRFSSGPGSWSPGTMTTDGVSLDLESGNELPLSDLFTN